MTPTPRTDAAVQAAIHRYQRLYPHSPEKPVDDTFARQLECELTTLTKALRLKEQVNQTLLDSAAVDMTLRTELAAAKEDNAALRRMFACCYAGTALYHDDGELQDNRVHPFIDFKRDSIEEIWRKRGERLITQANAIYRAGPRTRTESPAPHLDQSLNPVVDHRRDHP